MDQGLKKRIDLIEERLNTIEEDLQLFLRGAEEVKLRKNKLQVEIRELDVEKANLEAKSIDLRRKLEEVGIFVEDFTAKEDILHKKIDTINTELNRIKVNRLIVPFVSSLIVIAIMTGLYMIIVLWG